MPNNPVPWPLVIVALASVAAAIAAMSLRNLVHCALSFMVALAGIAAIYLQLGAQFVGFAQFLIYVGAVAILIVFAILLTRGNDVPPQSVFSSNGAVGVAIAFAVFAMLSGAVLSSKALIQRAGPAPEAKVQQIGEQLMTRYILPLEIIGVLLTAALIGAVLIAMREKEDASS